MKKKKLKIKKKKRFYMIMKIRAELKPEAAEKSEIRVNLSDLHP